MSQSSEIKCGAYVYLGVTDSGIGMSQDLQSRIFEPFFTTKEQGKGTGLGLSTVYSIVHECGGRIRLHSEVGQGTTFHIYLPRQTIVPTEQAECVGDKITPRGSETVLLVEDQAAVRLLAKVMLDGLGYNVLQASDGPEAILLARQYSGVIHLLLTDVILPKMNGKQIADELKAVRPGIKILFMSGYAHEIISQHGVLDNGVAYLSKPFRKDALAHKIRDVLAE